MDERARQPRFWDCPYFEFDESYDDESGDCFESWECGHPQADITETNIHGYKMKHYPPCELECGDGCAFPDVWKEGAA